MVDSENKEPLAMEDLASEDVVSNVSSFEPRSQDYSSTAQGSEMSHMRAYSVNFLRKSSHQLQENQDAEPIIPNSSNKEARNRKSAVKPVVSGETRARWAMLRSLVGVADAEDETETGTDSGVREHEIENDLPSGEAGYQASDNNLSQEESESHKTHVLSTTVVPSGQSVATEMLTASRNLLANSAQSARNETASTERYLQNVSKDPQVDIRGLSAGLQGEKIDSVEKDFKELAGFVGNVLRDDTHGVERIVHIENETIENAIEQATVQGIERTLHTEGERIKDATGAFGKAAEKVLEEDAHEVKKAFEKGEGLLMGAQELERTIYAEGQEISNDIRGFGRNTGKVLEKDAHEIKKAFEKGEGSLMGAQGLKQAIHAEGQEINNDIGGLGRNTAKVLEKDAHEIKGSLEKGVGSLIGAHTQQLYPQGRNYASHPLGLSSPSAESKINTPHQQKQMNFPNSLGLPSGLEESHPHKQRSLVNPARPRTPSAEPQTFAHPQKHMDLLNPTRSPLPSPNSQVQNLRSRDHTNSPGSFRPNTHSAAPKMEKYPQMNSSNPLTFNASHPDLRGQPSVQGPPMPKPPLPVSPGSLSNLPPAVLHKQLPPSPLSSSGPAGNYRPVLNTTARPSRPVPPSVIDSQHPPLSVPPTNGTRTRQANSTHIPPTQPSQKPAIPPQREQFPSPSANGAVSQPANNNQYVSARPPLPSQGPAPRNQQVPFSTPSPSGGTIVQPTNSDNPPPHRPLSPLPGPGSRLQQHMSPIPSTHGPIIQPSNKSDLPPSSALPPLPVQRRKPLDNQLQASQTSLGPPSPRLHTTEIHSTASQTPQAGPPSNESVVPSQAPIRKAPQPFDNQSKSLSNNSLQPSSSDLHLMPTGNTHASGSLATNQDSCESSLPQFPVQGDPSMHQDSQSDLGRQSPSNASLKTLNSPPRDSSIPSPSTQSITPQPIPLTEPSPTTAQHPLASAFENVIGGFKQRSEAAIAAGNGHPGFLDVMIQLLVKVGEDAMPAIQQRLEENQRRG